MENKDEVKFEDALSELESIVKKMENGNLSLDESLGLFEHGIALTRLCSSKLEHAGHKIEKLVEENMIEKMEID
jgi:exodeoxyribonuclease VII small subunit